MQNNILNNRQSWRHYKNSDGDITPTNEICNKNTDCEIATMLPNHGYTISQWAKPVAMVKGNVCNQPIKSNQTDKIGIKNVPEPPRRMCTEQIDLKQNHALNDLCQSYESIMLTTQKSIQNQKQNDSYYDGSDCQILSSMHNKQPIYANYITVLNAAGQQQNEQLQQQHQQIDLERKQPLFNHIKTKAEVHVDKSQFTTNDSKVG